MDPVEQTMMKLAPLMHEILKLLDTAQATRLDALCLHLAMIQHLAEDGPPGARGIVLDFVRELVHKLETN